MNSTLFSNHQEAATYLLNQEGDRYAAKVSAMRLATETRNRKESAFWTKVGALLSR